MDKTKSVTFGDLDCHCNGAYMGLCKLASLKLLKFLTWHGNC